MMTFFKKYIKQLAYYSLCLFESFLNFCFCLVGYYPCIEFSTSLLVMLEAGRISKELSARGVHRSTLEDRAHNRALEAFSLEEKD